MSTSLFSTLGNLHKISQNYLEEFVESRVSAEQFREERKMGL